jgi:hypothetical protein
VPHVVLLGDSVFDNQSYVPGGPAVIDQVRQRLPMEWQASLLAVDGDVTNDVPVQLESLPRDATHLVVSVGGNDALMMQGVLTQRVPDVGHALVKLGQVQQEFARRYRQMLTTVMGCGLPVLVCTIYDACPFDTAVERQVIPVALSLFDDTIVRVAKSFGVGVLELRDICDQPDDFSTVSPIEPSVTGGGKIATAIVQRLVTPGQRDGQAD